MTDTSMIERVARAIMEARGGCHVADWREAEWNPSVAQALSEARAAIEAMRPIETQDVNCALGRAADAKETPMHDLVRSFWQSMIDKALES